MKSREEVLRILAGELGELRERFGVVRAGIFGSLARGEAGEESDIDVVVTMPAVNLFTMVHLTEYLEAALQAKVDVVRDREDLNPRLRKWIDREAIYVEGA